MHRFRASKYRNAAAKPAKREGCITDINVGSLKSSCGNHIKASTSFMAFNVDVGGGGSIAVLPVQDAGRKDNVLPLLHSHSDFVTDMDFSPFDDDILCTCSYDRTIKLWQIPQDGLPTCAPLTTMSLQQSSVENVLFHPSARDVLASSCSKTVTVWDLHQSQEKYTLEGHGDLVQSLSWKGDGSLLVTSSKDKMFRIFDPRSSSVVMEGKGFGGIKDSRVLWLGNKDQILCTGFDSIRQRQVAIWDTHNLSAPLAKASLDSSTGILMPFFDADTNMLFLAGKGDSSILFFEVLEKEPVLSQVSSHICDNQHKGVAMLPKLALDIMSCEVVRLLQLSKSAVSPISYCVPRKTYREFHEDLFPETHASEPAMTAEQWFDGANTPMRKVSLDPAKHSKPSFREKPVSEQSSKPKPQSKPDVQLKPEPPTKPVLEDKPVIQAKPALHEKPKLAETPAVTPGLSSKPVDDNKPKKDVQPRTEPAKAFSGVRTCKFRHIEGVPMHKSNNIENIRNLSMSTFGDCDGLQVNREFVVFPLAGPGGQLAVLRLNKPCRLPDSGSPVIQCGSTVMDFVMDPFDNHSLAVACENGFITVWQVPDGGLTEILDEPQVVLKGHTDKPNVVRYHSTCQGLLASAAYDMKVKLWDLNKQTDVITLSGHSEQVFSLGWSLDGTQLASVSRDKKIRLYDPRAQDSPVQTGPGPEGSRGARVIWGGPNGDWLIVSGFNQMSRRIISLYDRHDLTKELYTSETTSAPSLLIPFYDEDSSVLFLNGKGDTTLLAYEVSAESPHLFELSHHRTGVPYQAFAFLDKMVCDVREVEFARAVKLSKTTVEQIKFHVPRVKMEFFQDDLFPDTRVKWEPVLTSAQWLAGQNKEQRRISVCPADMKSLSQAPKEAPKSKKYDSRQELDEFKSTEQKKEELLSSMVKKLGNYEDDPLPQDLLEGVDDDEWDD